MKRRVFALALAGLMTFSMAACGNSGGSSSGGNAAAGTDEAAAEAEDKAVAGSEDAENKLVIWTLADDLKQFAEHYCEQNPDTQIETVVIAPADYLTKIQSAMRGKAKEPDIIVAEPQMLDTMYENSGVGLAAPQVGVLKKIVVIDVGEGPIVLINPEIIETSGEQTGEEGCLSVPGKWGIVTRPDHVKVRALNQEMEPFEMEGEGLLARAFCHEIDHLHGELYVDKTQDGLHDVAYGDEDGEETEE